VDGIRIGIIVEVGVIDVVEESSAARVGVGIVDDKVSVVEKKDSAAGVGIGIVGDEVGVIGEVMLEEQLVLLKEE
jgi:hypothetical protein